MQESCRNLQCDSTTWFRIIDLRIVGNSCERNWWLIVSVLHSSTYVVFSDTGEAIWCVRILYTTTLYECCKCLQNTALPTNAKSSEKAVKKDWARLIFFEAIEFILEFLLNRPWKNREKQIWQVLVWVRGPGRTVHIKYRTSAHQTVECMHTLRHTPRHHQVKAHIKYKKRSNKVMLHCMDILIF